MPLIAQPTGATVKAKLFRGLADPSRLAILESLRNEPLTVGEIVLAAGLSQSNTSNHLACLHECGLVSRKQRGKFVVYGLADDRVGQLLALSEALLADTATGVYLCTRYGSPEEGQ